MSKMEFDCMMKKISPFPQPPFLDVDLGADVTDLDNYTYFDTLKKLKSNKSAGFW